MSNETLKYAITEAKSSYDAFKYLVDSRSVILKISTSPQCVQCNMSTRWAKNNGLQEGIDYVELMLTECEQAEEKLAYIRQVVRDAFGVTKIPNEAPWFINLRKLPKTTSTEGEEVSATDFNSPALQLFGFQPSNLSILFSEVLAAREQEMRLVA